MRVVIYTRYSSHSQTEQSIEGQLQVCYEYAKNNGYTVIEEYIDRAQSGTTDNRAEFQRMIADSSKHTFDDVLIDEVNDYFDGLNQAQSECSHLVADAPPKRNDNFRQRIVVSFCILHYSLFCVMFIAQHRKTIDFHATNSLFHKKLDGRVIKFSLPSFFLPKIYFTSILHRFAYGFYCQNLQYRRTQEKSAKNKCQRRHRK